MAKRSRRITQDFQTQAEKAASLGDWKAAAELAGAKKFTFTAEEMDSFFEEQSKKGFPAVHHSEQYEVEYKPAYRVVNLEYLPFLKK